MINIIYSDENDRLTPEVWSLMQQAAEIAIENEFGAELKAAGIKASELDAEIGVSIVEDDEILELNREFRHKDSVTDVLSFPQFDGHESLAEDLLRDDETDTLIGDVVICHEQALRQAAEYGTGATRELLYLFVHSIMHLFGYDHEEDEDKKVMREKEETVLSAVGVSR